MAALAERPVAGPLDLWFSLGENQRFELVRGRLIEMEPASEEHALAQMYLGTITTSYVAEEESGKVVGENYGLRTGEDQVRLPDLAFYRKDGDGRLTRTHAEGPADLVMEVVSPSSRRTDRGEKFEEYEAAGVREYWIVDPERRRVEAFALDPQGNYQPIHPDAEGILRSVALPGFGLKPEWIWERRRPTEVLRVLGVIS